jgi:hypothetical protein
LILVIRKQCDYNKIRLQVSRKWEEYISMEIGLHEKIEIIDACDVVARFKIRAIQLGVPNPDNINDFERLIEVYLAPAGITHIMLCLDYSFDFKSHPEIVEHPCTTVEIAKRVSEICRRNSIQVVPGINVLAHQSTIFQGWEPRGILRAYPDMEEKFEGEIHSSKCVCSRHPKLRPIVYDMIDDLMEAFGTKIIHTGFDEVWDIGKCPRCKGVPDYILFAQYINDLNDYIKSRGGSMWMWGDQLIDGYLVPSSNPGYETCVSSLHKAVDLIAKDILICDWHYYDEPLGQLSPSYWVVKGLPFITCAFNSVHGTDQLLYATRVVQDAPNTMGTMLTTWCKLEAFIKLVEEKYPEYLKTGELHYDASLENSSIENRNNFADQSSNMFLKMFVRR